MEIRKVGSQPSGKGPADWFTGTVPIDPLFTAPAFLKADHGVGRLPVVAAVVESMALRTVEDGGIALDGTIEP